MRSAAQKLTPTDLRSLGGRDPYVVTLVAITANDFGDPEATFAELPDRVMRLSANDRGTLNLMLFDVGDQPAGEKVVLTVIMTTNPETKRSLMTVHIAPPRMWYAALHRAPPPLELPHG